MNDKRKEQLEDVIHEAWLSNIAFQAVKAGATIVQGLKDLVILFDGKK